MENRHRADVHQAVAVLATTLWLWVPTAAAQRLEARASELAGTSWHLVQFEGGDDTLLKPDDPARYAITFNTDGTVAVRLDCNRGRGTWTSERPGHLAFGPLALTLALCPEGSLHDQIVKQWPYVRSYVLRDGHLHLSLMADGGIYEFAPAPAPAAAASASDGDAPVATPSTFEHTRWAATQLAGISVSGIGVRAPHLVFDGDRVSGSDGCNRVTGTYTRTGDGLEVGQMASTRMACPGTATVERAFAEVVQQVRRWRIAGEALEFMDVDGRVIARFESRAE